MKLGLEKKVAAVAAASQGLGFAVAHAINPEAPAVTDLSARDASRAESIGPVQKAAMS